MEMDKLIEKIKEIQGKLDGLRQQSLDEIPTRTKIVNPLLEALGWNIHDQDEVQEEYPTFDKQKVDYALKINHKPRLLVEAKQLDYPLNDKAVGQVAGYAVRAGIVWFILTNGIKWKVYRIAEGIQPPEMLVDEVSFDPREAGAFPLPRLVEIIGHISKKEVVEGKLDIWGDQTFTDRKVGKALDSIMRDPSRKFLNMLRSDTNDESLMRLGNQKVKESISRILAKRPVGPRGTIAPPQPEQIDQQDEPGTGEGSASALFVQIFESNNRERLTDEEIQEKVVKAFPTAKSWRRLAYVNYKRWAYNTGRLPCGVPKEKAKRWVLDAKGERVESTAKAVKTHTKLAKGLTVGFLRPAKPKVNTAKPASGGAPIPSVPPKHRKGKKPKIDYGEAHHTSDMPKEVFELYHAIDRFCLSLKPGSIVKRFLAKTVDFSDQNHRFCAVHLQQSGLRVWLKLKYSRLENPPSFARDVSNVGTWGKATGDLELGISNSSQLEEAFPLIRKSFETVSG